MSSDDDARRRARQLAAQAAASGDPAGWFETLQPPRGEHLHLNSMPSARSAGTGCLS
jgi:hypothetical protein